MSEEKPPLLIDFEALLEKHDIPTGMLVIPNKTEFMLVASGITNSELRSLGKMLIQHIPEKTPVYN